MWAVGTLTPKGKLFVVLTNCKELGTEAVVAYRYRWRLENLFKYCSSFDWRSGISDESLKGALTLTALFLGPLCSAFRCSLSTLYQLLSHPCEVNIINGQVTLHYAKLSHRFLRLLQNYVEYLNVTCRRARLTFK